MQPEGHVPRATRPVAPAVPRRSGLCDNPGPRGHVRSDTPDEPIDLTPEQRRRIDEVFAGLPSMDEHGVIGVPHGSDAATIRRAYYERVAEFHPDRFFRKKIGGYLAKIEAISRRVTDAYEALSSRERRVPRDPARRTAPAPPSTPPKPSPAAAEALRALKQQLDARRAEARRLVVEAARATSHGDHVAAVEAYRKAALLSPNDPAIAAAHEAARRAIGVVAVEAHAHQAELEERFGHWVEAARTWRLVAEGRPTDAHAHARLAETLLRTGGDASDAVRAAAKAAQLEPSEPLHRELLARAQAAHRARAGSGEGSP